VIAPSAGYSGLCDIDIAQINGEGIIQRKMDDERSEVLKGKERDKVGKDNTN
jgi:hypothetical protein